MIDSWTSNGVPRNTLMYTVAGARTERRPEISKSAKIRPMTIPPISPPKASSNVNLMPFTRAHPS